MKDNGASQVEAGPDIERPADVVAAAVCYAAALHSGQVYRGMGGNVDEPYILHLLRVMMTVPAEARVVAVLHDCYEDYGVYPNWLNATEVNAIHRLSRSRPFDYQPYIESIATCRGEHGRLARIVKLADARDNLSRNPEPRLAERYRDAIAKLAPLVEAEAAHPRKVKAVPAEGVECPSGALPDTGEEG